MSAHSIAKGKKTYLYEARDTENVITPSINHSFENRLRGSNHGRDLRFEYCENKATRGLCNHVNGDHAV